MVHKPERWAVNAAGVAPEWQWAWRDLRVVMAFDNDGWWYWRNGLWEKPTNNGAVSIVNGSRGLAASFDESTQYLTVPPGDGWQIATGQDFSVCVFFDPGSTTGTAYNYILSAGTYNTNNSFQMYFGEDSVDTPSTNRWFFLNIGTAIIKSLTEPVDVGSGSMGGWPMCWTTVRRNNVLWHYLNGVDDTDGQDTKDDSLMTTQTLNIGRRQNADPDRYFGGQMYVIYKWDRALSDEENWLLARDPFGPIRPRRLTPADVTPIDNPVSFKEQFRGSASDPWDVAEWVEDSLGVGEVVIHSDGIGRAAGGATNANAATYSLRTFGSSLELAVDVQCTLNTVDCSLGFMVGTAWLNTSNEEADLGYGIWVPGNAAPELFKTNGASYIALGSFGVDPLTTPYYTYKIRYDSASGFLQAKQWVVGESEPGWQIGVFDTEHQGETFRVFVTEWGETGASNGVRLKNLTVSTLRDKSDSFRTKVFVP